MFPPPRAIEAAVARVVQRHPYSPDGTVDASPRADDDASRAWERLLPLAEAPDQLATAIRSLSPHAVRVVLYGAPSRLAEFNPASTFQVLEAVFRLVRPDTEAARALAWDLWWVSNGAHGFRSAAEQHVSRRPEHDAWPVFLRTQQGPLAEALSQTERARMPLDRWASTPSVALANRPLIMRALRRWSLRPERLVTTCAREGSDTVARWMSEALIDSERDACYSVYLRTTYRVEWKPADAILVSILARYRAPAERHSFWNAFEPAVIVAFDNWLKLLDLMKLLGEDEHAERVTFWKKFLPWIRKSVANKDGEVVLICFERWLAAQFVNPGVATYMFPIARLNGFQRADRSRMQSRVHSLARIGEHLGRYAQQGHAYTWQAHAEHEVQRVMRTMEKRGA